MRMLVGATMTLWILVIASVVYPLLAHVDVARGKNVGDVVTEIRIERTVYISPDWSANAEIGKAYPAQIDKGHTPSGYGWARAHANTSSWTRALFLGVTLLQICAKKVGVMRIAPPHGNRARGGGSRG